MNCFTVLVQILFQLISWVSCFSNIDVRIQQAELEYQLGREELNLLTLLEETRALQICLDESNKNSNDGHTLYRYLYKINSFSYKQYRSSLNI